MKKVLILLCCLVLFIPCAEAEQDRVRRFLIDWYELNDDEVLDQFIEFYNITEESLQELNVPYLYDGFDNRLAAKSSIHLNQLLSEEAGGNFDPDCLSEIALVINDGKDIVIRLLDYPAGLLAYGSGELLHDFRQKSVRQLSEEELGTISFLTASSKPDNWKTNYETEKDDDGESLGWFWWKLVITDQSGGIMAIRGNHEDPELIPESLGNLVAMLVQSCPEEDEDESDGYTDLATEEYVVSINGKTYQLFETGMTWEEACAFCEMKGGHLATVTSLMEQNTIETLMARGDKNSYWIGGYWEDGWKWVSGEAFEYQNWGNGEPNNFTGTETKLMAYRNINPNNPNESGQWNDIDGSGVCLDEPFFGPENFGFICEWDN